MMGPTEPLASGVIAYNGDSDRGWNDPPTLSFDTVAASKKGPKLDLRKRVSHQEALTGRRVTSPHTQNPPNIYKQGNSLSNGLSSLTLSPQSQKLPPVVSPSVSPCHSRHSSGTYTPPLLPDAKCYGMVPPQFHKHSYSPGQNDCPSQPPYGNIVQGPPTTDSVNPTIAPPKIFSPVETILQSDNGIIHPLAQKSSTTSPKQPPPVTTTTPSNLGKPLFSFPHSFHMVPIASALDTSHVRSNPEISPDTSLQTFDNGNTTQMPCFQKNEMVTQGNLIYTPSLSTTDSVTALPVSSAEKRSPILNRAYQNGERPRIYTPPRTMNGSGKNSPTMNRSPVSTPTGGRSASSSPRSSTPDNGYRSEDTSRHNSVEFDSQEGLKVTVEAVEETILKCSDILKAREIEDVKKKVGTMKQQWRDGKLSIPVQMTMKSLTKALLDGDNETAQKLHLKLMVDYVGEVKQWMVAIKRLISAMVNVNSPVS